MIDTVKKA